MNKKGLSEKDILRFIGTVAFLILLYILYLAIKSKLGS